MPVDVNDIINNKKCMEFWVSGRQNWHFVKFWLSFGACHFLWSLLCIDENDPGRVDHMCGHHVNHSDAQNQHMKKKHMWFWVPALQNCHFRPKSTGVKFWSKMVILKVWCSKLHVFFFHVLIFGITVVHVVAADVIKMAQFAFNCHIDMPHFLSWRHACASLSSTSSWGLASPPPSWHNRAIISLMMMMDFGATMMRVEPLILRSGFLHHLHDTVVQ